MGLDCKIKVDDKYTSLDRWYVFDSVIKSSEVMSRSDALEKLRILKREKKLKADNKLWGDRQDEFIKRHTYWILEARKAIKSGSKTCEVVFYTDHDTPDDYYL